MMDNYAVSYEERATRLGEGYGLLGSSGMFCGSGFANGVEELWVGLGLGKEVEVPDKTEAGERCPLAWAASLVDGIWRVGWAPIDLYLCQGGFQLVRRDGLPSSPAGEDMGGTGPGERSRDAVLNGDWASVEACLYAAACEWWMESRRDGRALKQLNAIMVCLSGVARGVEGMRWVESLLEKQSGVAVRSCGWAAVSVGLTRGFVELNDPLAGVASVWASTALHESKVECSGSAGAKACFAAEELPAGLKE
ncbi:hypothetical protein EPH_0052680 [Eimeria praecox]|uniref:Uncharacterized protein n=1 Tax=Eimeria praecox TaxID=51316 RepID=U6GXY4_9EIME|nr:hypothetical protein EPH_0052680 [Eimeria praecox]